MSDFALRFGLALIVVVAAAAAIIISRRNYAKSAVFERNIEAFRHEFQRSIDAAQAATIKGVAKTIRDSISSVIRPIDSAVSDLDARLARLEQQQADASAAHMAGTQILDVRLARLEEHADASAIRNLEARLAGLEKHTEASAVQIVGTQKQSLEENERIAARLIGLEQNLAALGNQQQNLTALSDQLSSIKQTVDGAAVREQENLTALSGQQQNLTALGDRLSSIKQTIDESALREQENLAVLSDQQQNLTALSDRLSSIKQTIDDAAVRELDIKNSIEAISSRVLNAQTRLDELLPRLALGDKAREDQGTLIGLFVARLKKLNATLTDVAQRLSDLENSFRSKARQPEDHHGSILEHADCPSTNKMEAPVKDVNAADGVLPIEAKADGENAEALESPPQDKESSNEASVEREGRSADNSRADQHAT